MTSLMTGADASSLLVAPVRDELDRMMADRSRAAAAHGELFAELWAIASDRIRGGKLLRPRMLLGAFDAFADDLAHTVVPRDSVVRIAAGIEMLHYAFLLHDDVIDGDLLRRGRPNLIGAIAMRLPTASGASPDAVGRTRHWAETNAILMGDLLLAAVYGIFAREPLPPAQRARLLDLLDEAVADSIVGEQLDSALSDRVAVASPTLVMRMTRLKTATYTFELPLRAAAILADGGDACERGLGRAGAHLGTAFQLQDDLLSTFGRSAEHGKDALSDLREGKETAIIAFARTTPAWAGIRDRLGDPGLGPDEGAALRQDLADCGAQEHVASLVDDEIDRTLTALRDAEDVVPIAVRRFVEDLTRSIEGRRS